MTTFCDFSRVGLFTSAPPLLSRTSLPNERLRHRARRSPVTCADTDVKRWQQAGSSPIKRRLTNTKARAALRSLRYLSRYFSFWVFRGTLFILVLCSEELRGEEKTCAEEAEPELEAVCCPAPRKDWAAKACRACCRSSSVWGQTEVGRKKHVRKQHLWTPSCCLQDDGEKTMKTAHGCRWSDHRLRCLCSSHTWYAWRRSLRLLSWCLFSKLNWGITDWKMVQTLFIQPLFNGILLNLIIPLYTLIIPL